MSNFDEVVRALSDQLSIADSAELWEVGINKILTDANNVCADLPLGKAIALQVGCCSRWLAPHKFRWFAKSGQYVAPAGYAGRGRFLRGIPELDWDAYFERSATDHSWVPVEDADPRSTLIRIAFPARTALRLRASIHVLWQRGPKPHFSIARSYYGFRLSKTGWRYRAYFGPRIPNPDACTASPGPDLVPASEN